jgi:Ca2+-binding EF-hand superfamily protein
MTAAEKIKIVDTNGDGVLTADEHAAAAISMFEKMDVDHDGYLTKAELKVGHEKYMHKATPPSSGSVRPAD